MPVVGDINDICQLDEYVTHWLYAEAGLWQKDVAATKTEVNSLLECMNRTEKIKKLPWYAFRTSHNRIFYRDYGWCCDLQMVWEKEQSRLRRDDETRAQQYLARHADDMAIGLLQYIRERIAGHDSRLSDLVNVYLKSINRE